MTRNLLLSCIGGALALGLLTATAGAVPAPGAMIGKIGTENAGTVEQAGWRWHHRHFFFPLVYGYSYHPYRSYSYYSYRHRCCPCYHGYGYY